ncbi:uncharacterized protein [Argopecten irradians]|uniref:uncharacterized protein n=1 Tax=Argopecten irradians TaxID=31199 RepID=UPI0037139F16
MDDTDVVSFRVLSSIEGNDENVSAETEVYERDHAIGDDKSTGDGAEMQNLIEKQIEILSSKLQTGMDNVERKMQRCFDEFEDRIDNLQSQINSNSSLTQAKSVNIAGPEPECVTSYARSIDNLDRRPTASTPQAYCLNNPDSERYHRSDRRVDFNSNFRTETGSNTSNSRSGHSKMKPHTYDGTDDLEEYLTQFNIVSEINEWSYDSKSLHLAGSLVGGARALLNEMSHEQRRDYKSLVDALNTRFGSENRAEIFRSSLQSKVKGKDETIPELAQAIKRLTRKAYPNAASDMIELLSLDYFIDAITDTEVRLRLREVGPKTISEAERIAVRLEAHRIADKSRGRQTVRVVEHKKTTSTSDEKLDKLAQQVSSLATEVKDLKSGQSKTGQQKSQHGKSNNSRHSNWDQNRSNNYKKRWNNQQSRQYEQGHDMCQGNYHRLSSRTGTQQNN